MDHPAGPGPWPRAGPAAQPMTFLPVVQRELALRARQRWTYWGRPVAALVPLGLVSLMSLQGGPLVGGIIFNVLVVLATAFCLFEGVRTTADCISVEKREGTLGLLFLTDLRGYDVVLGKFVASSLRSLYGLLATFPIIGLTLLLGGVTAGEFWRSMLALANVLFASLSLGILVSTFARKQSTAVGVTALGLLAWLGLPFLATIPALLTWKPDLVLIAGLSPVQALERASSVSGYWPSLLVVHALGWALLGVAGLALPRVWREGEAGTVAAVKGRGRPARRRPTGAQALALTKLLDRSPVAWLIARWAAKQALFIAAVVVVVVGGMALAFAVGEWPVLLMGLGGGLGLLGLIFKLHVAWTASELLSELRRSEMLGLVLVTPAANRDMVDELGIGFWKAFSKPLLVLAVAHVLVMGVGLASGAMPTGAFLIGLQFIPSGLFGLLNLFADFYAIIYAGLWFGLKSGKPVQAFARTLLLVFVAAGILCCGVGFVASLIIAIFMRQRLKADLRRVGTGDPGAGRIATWAMLAPPPIPPPAKPGPAIPPVIRR